jgi:muramidase (phage lysozyme)
MSIFKDTLTQTIQDQLTVRGNAFINRGATNIIYINGRAAWIRLTSGVDVEGSSNDFAKNNILQGGTLNNFGQIDVEFGGDSSTQQYDLRAGVGSNYRTNAYSNKTNGLLGTQSNLYGLRPMPGITGLEVSSLSPYGSVRQATITFNCWDIKQLELMEILYMRPGFLALVEWGWLPYLNNNGGLENNFNSYSDTFLQTPTTQTLQEHLISLYNQSVKHDGNIEGMLGYIKNYEWSSRPDGGYDCRTEIISTGEIMESLKVNYSYNYNKSGNGDYILFKNNANIGKISLKTDYYPALDDLYERNIIAGLMGELIFLMYIAAEGGVDTEKNITKFGSNLNSRVLSLTDTTGNITGYKKHDISLILWKVKGTSSNAVKPDKVGVQNDAQVYIDLDSLTKILSKNVIIANQIGNKKTPLVEISTKERTFEKTDKTPKDLLCLAHPLQISVDPTICLIKNVDYSLLKNISFESPEIPQTLSTSNDPILAKARNVIPLLMNNDLYGFSQSTFNLKVKNILLEYYKDAKNNLTTERLYSQFLSEAFDEYRTRNSQIITQSETSGFEAVSAQMGGLGTTQSQGSTKTKTIYILTDTKGITLKEFESKDIDIIINYTFQQFLSDKLGDNLKTLPNKYFNFISTDVSKGNNTFNAIKSSNFVSSLAKQFLKNYFNTPEINKDLKDIVDTSSTFGFLNVDAVKSYFTPTNNGEFGNISNIYINLNYVLNLSLDSGLESVDANEKREIHVYDFLKKLMYGVQGSIGSLNNFDIHIDPNDGVARIIDINYIDQIKPQESYNNAYTFLSNNPTDPNAKLDGLYNNIRSHKIRSQIFKNQTSIVAISAQNGGGQLGLDNETLVGFNRGIKNRILPDINPPTSEQLYNNKDTSIFLSNLVRSLTAILQFMKDLSWINSDPDKFNYGGRKQSEYNQEYSEKYKGALRDLIASFKAFSKSDSNFKSIIPTTLSLELDGIGGLIIGHMFRLPEDLLPEGYKSPPSTTNPNKIGRRLGYIITKLGHKVTNNDWTTQIDAQTIILEEQDSKTDSFNDILKLAKEGVDVVVDPEGNINFGKPAPINKNALGYFGLITNPKVPIPARALLDAISYSEGTVTRGTNNGYDILFGGRLIGGWNSETKAGHPGIKFNIPGTNPPLPTSAAGRYQFVESKTWVPTYFGDGTFSKDNQDLAGYNLLIKKRNVSQKIMNAAYDKALKDFKYEDNKEFQDILDIISYEWASISNSKGIFRYNDAKNGNQKTKEGLAINFYNVFSKAAKKYNENKITRGSTTGFIPGTLIPFSNTQSPLI